MTHTTATYKPTFMQKLLGRNYKWWYVMVFNFRSASAYAFSDLFYYLNQAIIVYISIAIWGFSQRDDTTDTLTYLIIGNIFLSLLLLNNHWRFADEVFSGKFSSRYILPINLFKFYFFNAIAYLSKVSLVIIFYIPLLFINRNLIQFSLQGLLYLFVFLILALLIKFFYNFIVGCSVFWLTNSDGLLSFSETTAMVLSGSFIPLSLINFKLIEYLPFAYFLHHPMQIYLGKYTPLETFYVFTGGIVWCLVLYFLAKWVFKMGLKRNEAVGL